MSDSLRGTWAVARHEIRFLWRDRLSTMITWLLPVVILVFAEPIYSRAFSERGRDGAVFAISSMTVLFSFSALGAAGASFFRDFMWGTWERARALPVTMGGLLAGKALPVVARSVVQQLTVLVLGGLLFGVPSARELPFLLVISTVYAAALTGLGMVVTSVSRSIQQVTVTQSFAMIILGGLGGALSPRSALPSWIKEIAPVSPAYWASLDYQRVLGGHGTLAAIMPGVGVLLAMTCVLGGAATVWFLRSAPRLGWG